MTEGEKSSGEACVRVRCDWMSGKTMQMHPIGLFFYARKLKETARIFPGRWASLGSWQKVCKKPKALGLGKTHERIEGNPNANVKICRCCNSHLLNYYDRIDLFGKTSERENLLQKLNGIGKIEVCEQDEDVLPTKICRKCFRKITALAKALDDFRSLCSKSRENQIKDLENVRLKRGRKACSPQEPNEKRRPSVTAEENSTALRVRMSLFFPTPDQHPGSAVSTCDILPLLATAEKDDSVAKEQPNNHRNATELLKDAGLRNQEVCVVTVYSRSSLSGHSRKRAAVLMAALTKPRLNFSTNENHSRDQPAPVTDNFACFLRVSTCGNFDCNGPNLYGKYFNSFCLLLCELSEREVLKNKKPVCMEVAMGLVQEILYRVLNG